MQDSDDELHALHVRTLRGLFRWCTVVLPSLFLVSLVVYLTDRASGALALSIAFGGFQVPFLWAWRELDRGRPRRAQRVFLVAASAVVVTYLLFTPSSIALVGLMGIFLFIRITTVFDAAHTKTLGALWLASFVTGLLARKLLRLTPIDLGRAELFVAIGLPVAVALLFGWFDVHLGHTLNDALGKSEQRRRELSFANAELARANEELRSFTYAVSHDLRAPLVNLRGFAGELRRELEAVSPAIERQTVTMPDGERAQVTKALHDDIPEALRFIDSSVTRIDGLTSAVLKLSRLGRRELHPTVVDAGAVVRATLATLEHAIQAKGVVTEIEPLPEVWVDELALTQIFANLLGNAVAYVDPARPGVVRVSAAKEGERRVRFAVADNGRGIAAEDHERIFELFRRVGPGDEPGEGMGLTYVDALVRRLGGRVWCESTLGGGATFYFTIDVADADRRASP